MADTPLSHGALASQLADTPITVHTFETVTSTNTELLSRAAIRAPEYTPEFAMYVAARQTAGHGSRGRGFVSPQGSGVYFSILLRPATLGAPFVSAITPACAVAAARAIDAVFGVSCGVKWVNDLILRGKKVGGVLAESSGGAVVCGFGINISPPDGGFADLPHAGASLDGADVAAPKLARERVAAETARNLYALYTSLPDTSFIGEYRARSVLIGRAVTVTRGGVSRRGRAVAIDDDFHLIAETDGNMEKLTSEEVSISYEQL
jgi:BirA family biotin operon repressor/biotin-[acetyl-CoA-carboxylase] ligase